jgi:hypothetical protein
MLRDEQHYSKGLNMTQHLGDHLGINILREQQCGTGVPEVMEADRPQLGMLQ